MNISIQGLHKKYPNGNQALKDVNLEIKDGMFGLLGPNGAGKSSLIRILVSLMKPSSGNSTCQWERCRKKQSLRQKHVGLPTTRF